MGVGGDCGCVVLRVMVFVGVGYRQDYDSDTTFPSNPLAPAPSLQPNPPNPLDHAPRSGC